MVDRDGYKICNYCGKFGHLYRSCHQRITHLNHKATKEINRENFLEGRNQNEDGESEEQEEMEEDEDEDEHDHEAIEVLKSCYNLSCKPVDERSITLGKTKEKKLPALSISLPPQYGSTGKALTEVERKVIEEKIQEARIDTCDKLETRYLENMIDGTKFEISTNQKGHRIVMTPNAIGEQRYNELEYDLQKETYTLMMVHLADNVLCQFNKTRTLAESLTLARKESNEKRKEDKAAKKRKHDENDKG